VLLIPAYTFVIPNQATADLYALSLHDALPILQNGAITDSLIHGQHRADGGNMESEDELRQLLAGGDRRSLGAANEIVSLIKGTRSEEHTSELQSREKLVCRLLLEKKK